MKPAPTALAALLSIQFALGFLNGAGKAPGAAKPVIGQQKLQAPNNKSTPTISPPPPAIAHATMLGQGTNVGKLPLHGREVLFIGNSLTSTNDLPGMLQGLAAAAGQRPLVYEASMIGGSSIGDQWDAGPARRAIRTKKFAVVVLQQGPSARPESQRYLLKYAHLYAKEIRAAGGQPALYMVWPFASRPQDWNGVSMSYSGAAKAVHGILFPVGEAWRAALRRDPKLELYLPDGLHPTIAGTYLAALVMYERLYLQSPIGLPSRFVTRSGAVIDLPLEQARLLQEAAAEANLRFGQ